MLSKGTTTGIVLNANVTMKRINSVGPIKGFFIELPNSPRYDFPVVSRSGFSYGSLEKGKHKGNVDSVESWLYSLGYIS